MAVRIGELLLKEKRITPDQLQEALNYQKANGGKLGFNLAKLGFVKDEELTALLSKQYGVPSINLAQFEIDAAVIKLIPADTAQKYQVVPLSRAGATLTAPDGAVYVGLEDSDRAFQWLEKALEARDWQMPMLKGDAIFDALRSDPRFPALLARIGLPL